MNQHVIISLIATFSFFLTTQTSAAQTQKNSVRRGKNIALGINSHAIDSTVKSRAGIGLFNSVDTLHGFQFGFVSAGTHKDMCGVNIGGLVAGSEDARGVQIASVYNNVNGVMKGLQLSPVTNYAEQLKGMQVGGFANIAQHPFRGTQIAGITNLAMGVEKGVQLAGLANITASRMRGLQIGGFNYADTLRGAQVGLLNVARNHPKGVQIGIINVSNDTLAKKIGLVNLNPNTRIDILAALGTTSKINVGLRFRNKSTYSILGIGTHYMGLNEKFSGALSYRLGQYLNISPHWSVSGDIGFYHIETFEEHSNTKPDRLYSLQGRLSLEYQATKNLAIFGSVGYGNTRYYEHNKEYKRGMIGQIGLAINWHRNQGAGLPDIQKRLRNYGDSLVQHTYSQKRYWRAATEVTAINAFVHLVDRYPLNKDYAQVTWSDLGHNFKTGFVWDNDGFSTNLSAHPYHGNLYFNAARSNGLNFWESAPFALSGSLMWEFLGENEPPAINDLFATTFGGIALGEVTHRISRLILNNKERGFRRFLREFAATVINPMGGLNRIIDGDAWKINNTDYMYYDRAHLPIDLSVSRGFRYLSDAGGMFRGEFNPYLNIFLEYGDPLGEDSTRPYDFFFIETTIGLSGNQPLFNRLHLLGQIWGTRMDGDNTVKLGVYQHFNYYNSNAVKDGTDLVPYRISEAAAIGPGLIMRFAETGVIKRLEQRLFLSGILLGGSKTDYYQVVDRDYNLGSGFSIKTKTHMELRNFGRFILRANYFRLFTWKGYGAKDYTEINPSYYNVQGDRSRTSLLEINPIWEFDFKGTLSAVLGGSYFVRDTRYKQYADVIARTFECRVGLTYHF